MTGATGKTVVIETLRLEGLALDWAVGKAHGPALGYKFSYVQPPVINEMAQPVIAHISVADGLFTPWQPCSDGDQAWELVDAHIKRLGDCAEPIAGWAALSEGKQCYAMNHDGDMAFGSTKRIAVCRAVVLAKLGTSVEVPADLVSL